MAIKALLMKRYRRYGGNKLPVFMYQLGSEFKIFVYDSTKWSRENIVSDMKWNANIYFKSSTKIKNIPNLKK